MTEQTEDQHHVNDFIAGMQSGMVFDAIGNKLEIGQHPTFPQETLDAFRAEAEVFCAAVKDIVETGDGEKTPVGLFNVAGVRYWFASRRIFPTFDNDEVWSKEASAALLAQALKGPESHVAVDEAGNMTLRPAA